MRRFASRLFAAWLAATSGGSWFGLAALGADRAPGPELGQQVAADVVARWATTVWPDGRGLPPGRGTAKEGRALYDAKCSSCHGPEGRGETAEELVGREPPLADPDAAQTVGAYWPYATTLFDYTRRAMPMDKPGSLSADETYAISAYLLLLNGLIGEGDAMTADSLAKVVMPNRDGFKRIDAK
jgi:mono/diheme cytochrome c family protein